MNVAEHPGEVNLQVVGSNPTLDPISLSGLVVPEPKTKKLSVKEILDSLSKYRIRHAAIRATAKPDGTGGKAEVVRASFKRHKRARSRRVAAKKLRFGSNMDKDKFSGEFVHEVEMLAGLHHPNIVQLIGFVENLEHDKAWIVLSWEPHGNVREFLASGEWAIPERISLIKDIFKGLKYLHTRQRPIRHGDLKSLNILVSSSYRAIIADFGSARALSNVKDRAADQDTAQGSSEVSTRRENTDHQEVRIVATANQLTLTGPAWSLRWAAPEVLNAKECLELSSDIWSAGWVCWEVMTGKLPFSELNSEVDIALEIVQEIDRLIPEHAELGHVIALCSLMTDCWKFESGHRPEIKQCYDRVKWMPSVPPLGGISSRAKTSSTALLLEMSYMHYLKGDYGTATLLYQQVLVSATAADDDLSQAQALQGLGDAYRGQSRFLDAKECYKQAQKIYIQLRDDQGRANTLRGLGDAYHCQSKYRKAKGCYTRAQVIYARISDDHGLANTLRGLGDVHRGQSKYLEAERCYTPAREIYIRIGDDQGKAHALRGMGDLDYVQSKYPEAERRYIEARDIFISIGDHQGRAHTLRGLGDVYYVQSKFPEAEKCYTEARDISIRIGDGQSLGNTLVGLGDVCYVQSKYPDAEGCYNEAQGIYVRIGDDQGQAHTLRALGDAYRVQFKYPEAERCYTQAREIYVGIGDDQGRANTLLGLGHIHRARGQSEYPVAEEYYTGARDIYTEIGDDQGRANTLRGLGDVYLGQSNYPEAERCYGEARDVHIRIGNDQGRANTLRSLGHLYRQRCRNTEAAGFYTEARDLYSRIGNRDDEKDCINWLAAVSVERSSSSTS